MSALRYSGAVRIRLTLQQSAENSAGYVYRCSLTRVENAGTPFARTCRGSVTVGAPAFSKDAVDSPEAYDASASAALAFISAEDDSSWSEAAAHDSEGSAFHVGRSPATANPKPPAQAKQHTIGRGLLRHVFHGTAESARVILAFDTPEAAAAALAIVGEPFAVMTKDPRCLYGTFTSEALRAFKATHAERIKILPCSFRHCHPRVKGAVGPCKAREIDALTHSVDVGPAFSIEVQA